MKLLFVFFTALVAMTCQAAPTASHLTIRDDSNVVVEPGFGALDGVLTVNVDVLATGIGSNVYVIYSDFRGWWDDEYGRQTISANYSRPIPNTDHEVWTVKTLLQHDLSIHSFYVRYDTADGRTFYANNGGQNFIVVPQFTVPPYTPSVPTPTGTSTATAVATVVEAIKSGAGKPRRDGHLGMTADVGICEPMTPAWSPNVDLIDTSDFYTDGKPDGGWFVTPIHATLLEDGRMYIVGWSRSDYVNCIAPNGTRKHGVSFILNSTSIIDAGTVAPPPTPSRNPTLVIPTPFADQRVLPADTLYCSGQVPLPDGRIFVVGGATYQNLGEPNEVEVGLSYARIFDPATGSYTVTPDAPIGTMWYPTAARLVNGDVLVTGGFKQCCEGDPQSNDNLALYHPSTDSWTAIGNVAGNVITPGIRDYTHVFVLPRPVIVDGLDRHVALMGYKGLLTYYNTDVGTLDAARSASAPNDDRSTSGSSMADDSTAFWSPDGDMVTMGGGSQPWKLDMYDPTHSTWTSLDATFSRDNPASVLLPDGTVLLLNGQNRFDATQVPPPQLYDPLTRSLTTLDPWTDDQTFRAYHGWALLLKDGRVAVGGGVDGKGHSIGCERIDVRIFTPPYLRSSSGGGNATCVTRPIVSTVSDGPITFSASTTTDGSGNPTTTVTFSNADLRQVRGAALMALGSFTHSFDQNQRYLPLTVESVVQPSQSRDGYGTVTLSVPVGEIVLEGSWNLFLVGADGTPSQGVSVRVVSSA
ncbi:hypothetical protein HKX48_004835 [Thoreauomyces humboldtii]|nr:hypothetical protein HKX48_004835 [Thoreauomyces humboldtii]